VINSQGGTDGQTSDVPVAMTLVVALGLSELDGAGVAQSRTSQTSAQASEQSQSMPGMMKMHEQMMGGRAMMMRK
jgi:hypothetical protein